MHKGISDAISGLVNWPRHFFTLDIHSHQAKSLEYFCYLQQEVQFSIAIDQNATFRTFINVLHVIGVLTVHQPFVVHGDRRRSCFRKTPDELTLLSQQSEEALGVSFPGHLLRSATEIVISEFLV